jgi:hypothetical protein
MFIPLSYCVDGGGKAAEDVLKRNSVVVATTDSQLIERRYQTPRANKPSQSQLDIKNQSKRCHVMMVRRVRPWLPLMVNTQGYENVKFFDFSL